MLLVLLILQACQSSTGTAQQAQSSDVCGASKFQHLVGGPVSATSSLKIDGKSRYYGRAEPTDPNIVSTRLNFVVSTDSVVDSLTNTNAIIIRVFCG